MQPLPRYRLYTRRQEYAAIAREVIARRWLAGDSCRELETTVCEMVGGARAVSAPRARVAIYLALRALIEPGQTVVLSPYTISDVINMVISAGGVPVFADIERETCNIDPAEIERLVDDRTGAVMITHLHGLCCDMDRIPRICERHRVPLVEDAAQAFGTRWNGRYAGTFGAAGIYSFGKYKNVNSFFGGMVVTPDAETSDRVRAEVKTFSPQGLGRYLREAWSGVTTDLATYPPLFKTLTYRIFRYGFLHEVSFLNNQVTIELNPVLRRELPDGYRRRMTPMQARLVLAQLPGVDEAVRARVRAAQSYYEGLRDIPEILLPPRRTDSSHMYTYFPIQVRDRQRLLRHLMRSRRDVAAQHLRNCADLQCFAQYHRDCPNARETARSVVLLPTYPRYSLCEVERNVEAIRGYFGRT